MGRGDLSAMPRHANPLDQTLLARQQRRIQRAAGAQSLVPLDRIGERVDLPQVDMVDLEPVERALDLLAGAFLVTSVTFGRQEEVVRLSFQPRRDAQLGVAVIGRGVDVIDAVAEKDFERLVGDFLRDMTQRRGAKNDPGALVSGAPELGLRDHQLKVPQCRRIARVCIVGPQFNSRGGCNWSFQDEEESRGPRQ